MNSTFIIDPLELNQSFLDGIKKIFKGKKIEITIKSLDETEYLLSSETNKRILLKSIMEIEENNVVTFGVEEFLNTYEKKLQNEAD